MLSITNLKTGIIIDIDGIPFEIIKSQHAQLGRGGAILRATLKNLITGANIEKTFKGDTKIARANISKSKAQFLYKEGANYVFMDSSTFEQYHLNQQIIGNGANFLIEGSTADVQYFNQQPINIELPIKMKFKVTQADPAVRGDSVSTPTKNAVIETGLKLKVPLFIKVDDIILIDTRSGTYIERAQS